MNRARAYGAALIAGFLCLAPRPVLDNSVNALLAAGDEGADAYARFSERFGTDEVVIVRVEHEDPAVLLREVLELTELLEEDPTVERVISAATAYTAEVDLLTDEDLGGITELPRLTPRFSGPLNRALGLFEPEAQHATLFGLGRVTEPAARRPLDEKLRARRAAFTGGRILLAGPPLLNLELDRAGRNVERIALPLLVGVCVLFLLIATRSVRVTAAILLPVALGVFATEGALGLLGGTRNIIVDITKPLLLVLLLASGLHLAVGYIDTKDIELAVKEKGRAIALALLTTAIGFSSLTISPIVPIRTFGLLTAGGLLFGIPLTLWVLPVILVRLSASGAPKGAMLERLSVRAVEIGERGRWPIILLSLVAILLGLFSINRLVTDPHAIRYFAPDHPLRADYEALERSGLGLSTVEVVVTSTSGFKHRAAIEQLDELTTAASKMNGVRAALSLPLFLREAQQRNLGLNGLPDQLFVDQALEDQAEALEDFIDRDGARLSLMIDTLDADQLDHLSAEVKREAARVMPGAQVLVTGNYRLLLNAQRSLIDTLQQSLLTTLILMEIVLLLLLRSLTLTLLVLVPNLFPVAVNFGVMRTIGIPLDLGTAMTGSIAIGIAVDNTLHFVVAWQKRGTLDAARSTGRAMIMNSIVISAGFFVLLISDFGPTRNFGLLAGAAMLTALFADLVLLPGLLMLTNRGK